jgi:membrane associated rhomboid family serine protease
MESPYQLTRGVKALLIANGTVFVLQLIPWTGALTVLFGPLVAADLFLHGQIWRLATYMFMHSVSDPFHLLFNMLALWMFGGELEERWGAKKFISLYFLFGMGSGLFSVFYLLDPLMRFTHIIGASGALLGLLTAYAVYYPDRRILLFFVIPIRAWMLVAGYAAISFLMAFSQGSGVAHLVHLGGIAVAFGYLRGFPIIEQKHREYRELDRERAMRERAVEVASRKRYFDEKIDPILEKISKQGMEALSGEEKKLLKQASNYKEEMKGRKVIPFEAFKKKSDRPT